MARSCPAMIRGRYGAGDGGHKSFKIRVRPFSAPNCLQPKAIRQCTVLHNDRNSFADDAGFLVAAGLDALLIDNADVFPEPAVLVEDCSFDVAAAADA